VRDSSSTDIREFIDLNPFSRYQALVIGLCVVAVVVEGFDVQAMGYVAPVVSRELHIARAALGPVLSSSLLGMMFGALALGPLGDRVGRKPIIVVSVLLVALGSSLTAAADSVRALIAFRLLTGFGLGGSLPNLIALNSEYTPKRLRATAIVIAGSGFSIGATLGGFASAGLLGRYGWRSIFVLGGVLPGVVAIVLIALLPESIRFLVMKAGQAERVARILSKIAPRATISPATMFFAEKGTARGFTVRQLFANGRARLTVALWAMFFLNLLDLYFLNNWLPTVIHDAGIALEKAIIITALFQAGGTVGALWLGWRIDRALSYRILAWAYVAASACVFLIGAAGTSVVLLACSVFASGVCVVGGQTGANALAAECYPTALRSTGVGWSLGIGRIGSIIGPLMGGALLPAQGGAMRAFTVAAALILIAGIAAFLASGAHVEASKSVAAGADS